MREAGSESGFELSIVLRDNGHWLAKEAQEIVTLLVRYGESEIRLKIDMLRIGHELSVGDKAPGIISGMWCPLGGMVSLLGMLLSPGEYVSVCGEQGSMVDLACSSGCRGRDMAPTRYVRLSLWS
jgi:hypothetical protein